MSALQTDAPESDCEGREGLTPVAALFVLSRLCHSLTYRPLLATLVAALFGVSEGAPVERRRCILQMVGACRQRDLAVSALCLIVVLASNAHVDDGALGALQLHLPSSGFLSLAFDAPADAAGLLPTRRRKKAHLLNVLTADSAAVQPTNPSEAVSSADASEMPEPDASVEDAEPATSAACFAARQEVTDALSRFLVACSCAEGYADLQALSAGAWLLKELAEPFESAGSSTLEGGESAAALRSGALVKAEQSHRLCEAAAAATAGLRELLRAPWGDALAPLMCSQWSLASRVAQAPALGDEHAAAQILYSAADTARAAAECADEARGAPSATAQCAEHALLAVRRWIVLHSLCCLLCGTGTLAAAPPLATPPDGYVCAPSELREGSAAPAIALEGVPCRVAFERGKEKNVALSVAACGVTLSSPSDAAGSCFTANVLLVEAKARGGASATGVMHAVAPAAGAEVRGGATRLCAPNAHHHYGA